MFLSKIKPDKEESPSSFIKLFFNRFFSIIKEKQASLIAQLVKNLPAIQVTLVQFPGLGRPAGKGIGYPLQSSWASLVAQTVKNLPAMRETWVRSLGWKSPWRRAWHPIAVSLPGESSRQRSLAGYSPRGCKELNTTEQQQQKPYQSHCFPFKM